MTTKKATSNPKTQVHTVYKTKDGTRVPSVTTILGVLDKPALLDWAWKCGLRGEDYKLVRDSAADIGTLAHYMIVCHLRGEEPDLESYSPDHVKQAENCLIKYWDWEKEHRLTPMLVEAPLVSDILRFGGTIDNLSMDEDGGLHLIDYKTGKAIYSSYFYQLAAYAALLKEHGYNIKDARILRIGRDEKSDFEERLVANLDREEQIFNHCLSIYNLKKGESK